MHADTAQSARPGPAPRTPATVIVAFRREYVLSVERLAAFLGLEADALREYEALGSAPPWVAYALLGVAYEQFGVEPVPARSEGTPQRPLPSSAPAPASSTSAEWAA